MQLRGIIWEGNQKQGSSRTPDGHVVRKCMKELRGSEATDRWPDVTPGLRGDFGEQQVNEKEGVDVGRTPSAMSADQRFN